MEVLAKPRTGAGATELTAKSMPYLERIAKPMLLLFVDKAQVEAGAKGAGNPDSVALAGLHEGSREPGLNASIAFAFTDGVRYGGRMASLGLPPQVLPAMAFNTKDGHLYPFPIAKPGLFQTNAITAASIRGFAQAFLRGEARPPPIFL